MSNPSHEEMLRKVMGEVTDKLTGDLRDVLAKTLSQTLEQQISSALTQALLESEVYRRISSDLRTGLQRIYKEISAASTGSALPVEAVPDKARADKLFHEASEQLSAVLTQTEQATVTILEVVERNMDLQLEAEDLFAKMNSSKDETERKRLEEINKTLGDDLNTIMLSLSFQDLTGQRIKRAVSALKEIESTVVELYLSTGLLLQSYVESPDKTLEEIEEETRKKVSTLKSGSVIDSSLKGPADASQKQIDDLLSQLGM
ncbi:MAG: protein phosphatase CheZ [Bilophila sp.]